MLHSKAVRKDTLTICSFLTYFPERAEAVVNSQQWMLKRFCNICLKMCQKVENGQNPVIHFLCDLLTSWSTREQKKKKKKSTASLSFTVEET